MICRPDAHGNWKEENCGKATGCAAHCDPLLVCDAQSVSATMRSCPPGSDCTGFNVYRRLDRLGCSFDPDAFWAGPDAHVQSVVLQGTGHGKNATKAGHVKIGWASNSCQLHEREGLEAELNDPRTRELPHARRNAYATLLAHGCNVRLSDLAEDGSFAHVELSPPFQMPADRSGIAPQPLMTLSFTPPRPRESTTTPGPTTPAAPASCEAKGGVSICAPASAPPLESGLPICTALDRLHASRRFAMCAGSEDKGVRVRVVGKEGDLGPFVVGIAVDAARTGTTSQGDGTKGGGGHSRTGTGTGTGTNTTGPGVILRTPATPSTERTISVPAAAGSAGIGALLAALAKWLFGRMTRKKPGEGDTPVVPSHAIQDVHVSIEFKRPPDVQVR